MRKIWLGILLFVVLIAFGMDRALNSPWLLIHLAPKLIARVSKDIPIKQITIARQQFFFSGRFEFKDVAVTVLIQSRPLVITIPALELSGIQSVLSEKRSLLFMLHDAQASFSLGQAQGVNTSLAFMWSGQGLKLYEGPLQAKLMVWDKIKIQNVRTQIVGEAQLLEFRDLILQAYAGTVSGHVRILYRPLEYVIDLAWKDLDITRLSEVNEQISQQLAGRIAGSVRVSGDLQRVSALDFSAIMPSGGNVNASLLGALTQYLPKSREKKMLDALIRTGGKLAVEVFSATIVNKTQDHIAGAVTMQSKAANLNLNLTHDIYMDGTWDDLLQSWKAIFHQGH
jgi:hypothetical protein